MIIGQVIGQEDVSVGIPSDRKDVLPRHTAILGTTGAGKSTTVARLVQQAQAGERAAFEELVRRTSRLVYARLFLETGDRHLADVSELVG